MFLNRNHTSFENPTDLIIIEIQKDFYYFHLKNVIQKTNAG